MTARPMPRRRGHDHIAAANNARIGRAVIVSRMIVKRETWLSRLASIFAW